MKTFYAWRQDQWTALARGFGALAVPLLLALVGVALEAEKVVKAVTGDAASGATGTTTATTTESTTSPAVLALIGALLLFSGAVWLRSRAVHTEFADDASRLSKIL